MNTLITSAGRRVSLVNYFQKESKKIIGERSKVITTDLHPQMSTACIVSDKGIVVGRFTDPEYMEKLLDICREHSISIVIPTIDTELLMYANHRDRFARENIQLIVSDAEFISICRDKRKMNTFFEDQGFKVPKTIDRHNPTYPLFIKPIDGSSSKDLYFIKDATMLSKYHIDNEKLMFMEYLSPKDYEEYTVDLYYDRSSQLRCVVPRVRIAVRGGETNKGITRKNKLVNIVREKLSTIEGARGCLTLQVFLERSGDDVYGIEINPRFGGGYPLSYLAGANYPAWIYKEYCLDEQIAYFEDWKADMLLLRHDQEVVIENFEYQG